ncbi:class I SAM-dependent methyltransferase [Sulfurihydrogenibium azorense]|uniref:class I SAM-dependent methyltransferase n=1 Tax=Sulfurihydrogenibium azorense TaxID=309806 RepID=UPI00391C1C6D
MTRFDMAALTWDEKPMRVNIAKNVAENIKKHIPLNKDMKLLDFGCGTGLLTFFLIDKVGRAVGVDSSQGMCEVFLKKAKENNIDNVEVLNVDLEKQDIDQKFDVIVSSMALHHVKDTQNILKKFYSLLNDGRYIAIADLVKEDGTFHDDNEGVEHFGFDLEELKSLFEKVGFKDVQYDIAYTVVKERDGQNREYPIFLMVGRK